MNQINLDQHQNMMNLLTGLFSAMQKQQEQQSSQSSSQQQPQLQMPSQQLLPQQQQLPTPQQFAAFNQFMATQMMMAAATNNQHQGFPFPTMLPPLQMPGTPLSAGINDPSGRKLTPKVNKETAAPLQDWFDSHLDNPYPSEEDMRNLKIITGFTDTQLGDWFRNKRRNYKKTHQGNVPWQIPTTTVRKRRASSISNHLNDSSSSPDSLSTAHSSPPPLLQMLPSTPTTSTASSQAMPSPSAYSFLLAALSTPAMSSTIPFQAHHLSPKSETSSNDDENVDVETVDEKPPPLLSIVKEEPTEDEQQEPSASSPPEKRAKL